MINRLSVTWQAVVRQLDEAIDEARDGLEAHGLDQARAEYLRGRVAMARELKALPERISAEQDG